MEKNKEIKNSIKSLSPILDFIDKVNDQFNHQIWWRGQAKSSWDLLPGVFREDTQIDEYSAILRFQQKALLRHSITPPQNDSSTWLFLMQHYGLKTRLLDWTESPLIGCFFTLSEKDHDGRLFALSPYDLNNEMVSSQTLLMPDHEESKKIIDDAFSSKKEHPKKILAVRPPEFDLRLVMQLSVFTLHGFKKPLNKIQNNERFLKSIEIKAKDKEIIQEGLKHLGIRRSTLFPDLENLAKEINQTSFVVRNQFSDNSQLSLQFPSKNSEAST